MVSDLAERIYNLVKTFPVKDQRDVLNLINKLELDASQRTETEQLAKRNDLWSSIDRVVAEAPADAWDDVPTDGSMNVDHYLYGAAKRNT